MLDLHNISDEKPNKNENNMSEIWTFLTKSGIINVDNVQDIIMANKKDQVRKLHTYTITAPSKEGGRWQTYYKDKDGKRKIIRAQT